MSKIQSLSEQLVEMDEDDEDYEVVLRKIRDLQNN